MGGAKPEMEREVVITRLFDAPRALVFAAWTEPKHLVQWWGPRGFTNPVCEVDLRVGGAFHIVMRAPDGAEHPMKGIFQEIVPPERLVFTNIAVDAAGKTLLEGVTSVTFTADGAKTRLTLTTRAVGKQPIAAMMLQGMELGWTQSIDKLEDYMDALGGKKKEAKVQVNPYLTFNGNCEEAFKFYADCLKGKIVMMMTHAGTPAAGHVPDTWQNKIIHARMTVGDWVLMGSDAPPDRYRVPQGISISLGTNNADEADRVFNALAEKGDVQMPIQKTFWAVRFGVVTDRFGIPWMINCEG